MFSIVNKLGTSLNHVEISTMYNNEQKVQKRWRLRYQWTLPLVGCARASESGWQKLRDFVPLALLGTTQNYNWLRASSCDFII